MSKVRFTAYISQDEREGIKKLADKSGTSDNYVVRTAIRNILGLPVHVLHVTNDTDSERANV